MLIEHRAETVVVCDKLDDDDFRKVVETSHSAGCESLSAPRRFSLTSVEPQLIWRRGQPLVESASPGVKGQEPVVITGEVPFPGGTA